MGNIRKQTIVSSLLVYLGFFFGAINTYLYIKEGYFTTEQFALTRIFFDVAQNFYVFASLGVIPIIYKFYPYYKNRVSDAKNDLLTWALASSLIGFLLVLLLGIFFEPLVVRKFSERSLLIVEYYYYIFPFAFGMLLFSIFEGYCWALQKTIVPNFLKETALRLVTTIFILLFYFKYISYHAFIVLFASLFGIITIVLIGYLLYLKKLHLTFKKSEVTKKLQQKMLQMQSLVFGGMIIQVVGQTMDSIFIAGLKGLAFAGVYTLANYAANFIQVPQRSMQSIATGILAQAWKEKNYTEINRIYQRSSINMLVMSLFIFGFLLLNVQELFSVLSIQNDYAAAINLIIILGLVRVIDAGTGVNGTIIATSTFWKFDFFTGIILLAIRLPLAYYLIKQMGIIGAAYSELISLTIYNSIRFQFLKTKFNLQPFTHTTWQAITIFIIAFFSTNYIGSLTQGWYGIILKSLLFSIQIITFILILNITPDAKQLLNNLREKIRS